MANDHPGLQIRMLGEFLIENENYMFPQTKKRNLQLGMLLAYLISNRSVDTTKGKLIEILWPDEESNNPEGALRNLIYRARGELKNFYPEEEKNFLLLNGGSYLWNNEIDCEVDIDLFEKYCKMASIEQDINLKYEYCEKVVELYRGDFLPEYASHDWVVFRASYYRELYTSCILKICTSLMEHEYYHQIIDLCNRVTLIEQMDAQVHEMKIQAYLQLQNPQKALEYYDYIVELYYSKIGVELSERMKSLYHQIISSLSNKPVNVDELEEDLKESRDIPGTFYCNYDVFKNIYRISARLVKRSLRARFLVLLTLTDETDTITGVQFQEESERLRGVIFSQLRKNDIFSQYNVFQYSLILIAQNKENAQKAVTRIMEKYEQKKVYQDVILVSEIRQIM